MKQLIPLVILITFLLALTMPFSAYSQSFNKNQFFIGSKALSVAYSSVWLSNEELSGYQIGYSRVFQRYFEIRGSYYNLDHTSYSDITIHGFDLGLVAGKVTSGFKAYGGAGFFSETFLNSSSYDFSGFQLIGGLGYNWPSIGLDFIIALRNASDYESFALSYYGIDTEAAAASASLNLGFRF